MGAHIARGRRSQQGYLVKCGAGRLFPLFRFRLRLAGRLVVRACHQPGLQISKECAGLRRVLVAALFAGDAGALITMLIAQFEGTMNTLGWFSVALQALFALGYGYGYVTLRKTP